MRVLWVILASLGELAHAGRSLRGPVRCVQRGTHCSILRSSRGVHKPGSRCHDGDTVVYSRDGEELRVDPKLRGLLAVSD
jgi:hypothetical protein